MYGLQLRLLGRAQRSDLRIDIARMERSLARPHRARRGAARARSFRAWRLDWPGLGEDRFAGGAWACYDVQGTQRNSRPAVGADELVADRVAAFVLEDDRRPVGSLIPIAPRHQ